MKTLLAIFSGIMLFSAFPALAEGRSISVSGTAKEDVVPDQAVLSVSLVNRDKVLAEAKKQNDALAEKLVAIIRKFDIPKEKVTTSGLYINPEYNYPDGKQQFVGYMVNRSLRITIDKIDNQEKILSALVDAKIDQVGGVEFQLSDPEAREGALRVKAFENAKAKAEALAKAAGSKLGAAITIATDGAVMPPPGMPRPMMMAAKASMESSVAPSLPGVITLQESVSVTFALE